MYFVYLLECVDGTIYTGITTDVGRRFDEHKLGIGSSYTKAHGAKRIIYSEEHPNRSAASRREAAIKKLTRGQKLAMVKSVP